MNCDCLCDIRSDFEKNGVTSELDGLDHLMVKMRNPNAYVKISIREEEELARRNAEARYRLTRTKKCKADLSCVFCKRNHEERKVYKTHNCKDDKGSVTCPILQNYKCPLCGATGKKAHTINYCPMKYVDENGAVVAVRSYNYNTMLWGLPSAKCRH